MQENLALKIYDELLENGFPEKIIQEYDLADSLEKAHDVAEAVLHAINIDRPMMNILFSKHFERVVGTSEWKDFLPSNKAPLVSEEYDEYGFLTKDIIAYIGEFLSNDRPEYVRKVVEAVIAFMVLAWAFPMNFTPSNDLVIRGSSERDKVRIAFDPMKRLNVATLGDAPVIDFGYDDVELGTTEFHVVEYLEFFFLLEVAKNYYNYKEGIQGDNFGHYLNELLYVIAVAKDAYDEECEDKSASAFYFFAYVVPYISLRIKDYEF